jgi:hypothetical protein
VTNWSTIYSSDRGQWATSNKAARAALWRLSRPPGILLPCQRSARNVPAIPRNLRSSLLTSLAARLRIATRRPKSKERMRLPPPLAASGVKLGLEICRQNSVARSQSARHGLGIPSRSERFVAGADKEEFPPLLPPGFHPMDLATLRRLCVDRFPASFTRPGIMNNLGQIIARINSSGIPSRLWIDGSFLTEKLNPDDVDISMNISAQVYFGMPANQRAFFDGFRNNSLYASHRVDNYGLIIDESRPEGIWLLAWWLRQFGFSRADEMKGIAEIQIPFVVVP